MIAKRVDLLLTDVIMPGLNGRELGRRGAGATARPPVLYMTGYSRNAVVHHGRLDEGVDLFRSRSARHSSPAGCAKSLIVRRQFELLPDSMATARSAAALRPNRPGSDPLS